MVNPLLEDDLAGDLRRIINEGLGEMGVNTAVDFNPLMQKLTMYVVARDHRVWRHAYKVGRSMALRITKIGAN